MKIGNKQTFLRMFPEEPEEGLLILPASVPCSDLDKAITREVTSGAAHVGTHKSNAVFAFIDYQTRVGMLDTNSGTFVR